MIVNGNKKLQKAKYEYKVELINNTHENLTIQKETYKKLVMLYQDESSWVGYISMCWTEPNQRKKMNIIKWFNIL